MDCLLEEGEVLKGETNMKRVVVLSILFVLHCYRQFQYKGTSLARRTLYFDRPLMFLDNALNNGQPQPAPSAITRAGLVCPVKALEDVRQVPGGNANTCIAYFHHRRVFARRQG